VAFFHLHTSISLFSTIFLLLDLGGFDGALTLSLADVLRASAKRNDMRHQRGASPAAKEDGLQRCSPFPSRKGPQLCSREQSEKSAPEEREREREGGGPACRGRRRCSCRGGKRQRGWGQPRPCAPARMGKAGPPWRCDLLPATARSRPPALRSGRRLQVNASGVRASAEAGVVQWSAAGERECPSDRRAPPRGPRRRRAVHLRRVEAETEEGCVPASPCFAARKPRRRRATPPPDAGTEEAMQGRRRRDG
jgi:hypothetical protein